VSCNQSYANQHQVELQLDPIPVLQVRADALRLQQVLSIFFQMPSSFLRPVAMFACTRRCVMAVCESV
jgi:hypothetical protein